jgi:bacillithiol biosynthesis cysteine-adding enzyme BshC
MITIPTQQLYNTFYHDYVSNHAKTHKFIESPFDVSWDAHSSSLNPDYSRFKDVKQVLIRQNKDNTSAKAQKYLDYLNTSNSVIIITGQQLGLFASPIYTIYKIISTLKLTEELNAKDAQFNYVPVFWLESEDHDFQEINHIGIFDKSFQAKQLLYKGKDKGKVSLRHYSLESSINTFLSEIRENLLDTEFSEMLFKQLDDFYREDQDWTSAITLFLKEIFSSYGLLFFFPGDKEIKNLSIDFFSQALESNEDLRVLFNRQSKNLNAQGYQSQVKNLAGQTFVHIEQDDGQRAHLYKNGEGYYFKNTGTIIEHTEILKRIKTDPTAVSTTVVSRPLLQSWLLPVGAYVAGPGEIAYWAQISPMFTSLDLVMPIVYPRISATIVEPKISRYIKKYELDPAQIPQKKQEFIREYFRSKNEAEQENPIKNLSNLFDQETDNIVSYLKSLDQTLVGIGNKSIDRLKQTLSNLENRVIAAREQKDAQLTNHLQQIHTSFYPQDLPQERFLSPVYYINKFGPEFINTIYSQLDHHIFDIQTLYL